LIVGTHQTTRCYIPADCNYNTHCKVNLKSYFLLLYGWHEACMSALSVSVDKHVGIMHKWCLYSSLQNYVYTCCMYFIHIMFCAVKFVPSVVGFVYFMSSGFLSVIVLSTSDLYSGMLFNLFVSHEFCLQMLTNCS